MAGQGPAADRFPKAASSYVIAIDGQVGWSREADHPRLPASLPKIMTALVLLEGEWKPDGPVRIGKHAASATGSRLGMRAGESFQAVDLLAAMLVSSANDACLALAEHASGNEKAFVARMNARATKM